jgi:hypothetical protein
MHICRRAAGDASRQPRAMKQSRPRLLQPPQRRRDVGAKAEWNGLPNGCLSRINICTRRKEAYERGTWWAGFCDPEADLHLIHTGNRSANLGNDDRLIEAGIAGRQNANPLESRLVGQPRNLVGRHYAILAHKVMRDPALSCFVVDVQVNDVSTLVEPIPNLEDDSSTSPIAKEPA